MSDLYKSSLGRTVKCNFAFYITDGRGRDGYITYNNGGFWKDNEKFIVQRPQFPFNKFNTFHSLTRKPAPWRYRSDGTGRDSYVMYEDAGLTKNFSPCNYFEPTKYFRSGDQRSGNLEKNKKFLTKYEIKGNKELNKIKNGVIERLYKNDSLPKLKVKRFASNGFGYNNEMSFNNMNNNNNYRKMVKSGSVPLYTKLKVILNINEINSNQI